MRLSLLFLLICFGHCIHSQVLVSDGKQFNLVNNEDQLAPIVSWSVGGCFCEEGAFSYFDMKSYPAGTVLQPELYWEEYMILSYDGYWFVLDQAGNYKFENGYSPAPKFIGDSFYTKSVLIDEYYEKWGVGLYTKNDSLIASYKTIHDEFNGTLLVEDENDEGYERKALVKVSPNPPYEITPITPFDFSECGRQQNFDYQCIFTEEGLVPLQNGDEKYGVLNHKGDTIVPFEYDKINTLNKEWNYVSKDGLWGVVDSDFKKIISFKFQYLNEAITSGYYSLGYSIAQENDLWFIIDSTLSAVNKERYLKVDYLNFSYEDSIDGDRIYPDYFPAITTKKNKMGIVDMRSADFVLSPQYDSITYLNGQICAYKGDVIEFYSIEFKLVNSVSKDEIQLTDDLGKSLSAPDRYPQNSSGPYFIKKENNKKGIIDGEGNVLVPCEYDQIIGAGFWLLVTKNNKCGLIDGSGKIIVPVKYEIGCKMKHDYYDKSQGFKMVFVLENELYLYNENGEILASKPWENYTEPSKSFPEFDNK